MKVSTPLLLIVLVLPLLSNGQKRTEMPNASVQVRQAFIGTAPALSNPVAIDLPIPGIDNPPDSTKQKRSKKVKAKDFPKPKVSKKLSKRKAKKAKTS